MRWLTVEVRWTDGRGWTPTPNERGQEMLDVGLDVRGKHMVAHAVTERKPCG